MQRRKLSSFIRSSGNAHNLTLTSLIADFDLPPRLIERDLKRRRADTGSSFFLAHRRKLPMELLVFFSLCSGGNSVEVVPSCCLIGTAW
jgi:hypothetical protein